MHRGFWILVSLTLLHTMAAPALAQILNGDFEAGGAGWIVIAIPPWVASFPPAGGNPNGYALIQSPSGNSPGGLGAILQGFQCGTPGSGSECVIRFDFRLHQVDAADNSGRVQVFIDNEPDYTSPSGNIDWTTVTLRVPCGDHSIALALEVDAGNNRWEASFDNVQADCEVGTPVDPSTWGMIKSTYEPTDKP
jgi:hypothetical protein